MHDLSVLLVEINLSEVPAEVRRLLVWMGVCPESYLHAFVLQTVVAPGRSLSMELVPCHT